MAQTVIPWGDTKAQKKWSSLLATDVNRDSYWSRKFKGEGENNIIEEKMDVASDAGDRVSYDLSVRLRQEPTYGDNKVKGKEEQLRFFSDEVVIDQIRHSVSAGGRMSRKRTVHDLRRVGKNKLKDYWRQFIDEAFFIYLSGARGINEEFITKTTFSGFATNPLSAPDSSHILFGGDATSAATIASDDIMSRALIERAAVRAKMMRSADGEATDMVPVTVEGEDRFVTVMSPYQEYSLRNADAAGWIDIQKAAAAAEGRNNPIFKGSLGMVNNVVLHCHENAIRFNTYGAGSNLPAARALFLARQAGVVAYGTPGGMRFMWKEEMEDYDNEPTVVAGCILGIKKTRYNDRDFGVIALDTYAAPTN